MLFFFISRIFQQICNHFAELRGVLGSDDRNAGLRLNGLPCVAGHLATGTGHVYWILHMLSHLKAADGVAGFLLANGALGDSDTLEIRKKLIQNDKVEAIVILPRELFITTDISVTLWILNQNKKGGKYHERMLRNREHEILFAKIACVQRKDTAYFLRLIQLVSMLYDCRNIITLCALKTNITQNMGRPHCAATLILILRWHSKK